MPQTFCTWEKGLRGKGEGRWKDEFCFDCADLLGVIAHQMELVYKLESGVCQQLDTQILAEDANLVSTAHAAFSVPPANQEQR